MLRRTIISVLGVALVGILPTVVAAQNYPDHSVTIVVPYSPGGTTDTVGRILAKGLTEELGQPFVIVNKPGTSGIIGSEFVSRAEPDGYTLLMGTISTHATNAAFFPDLPYDPVGGFRPIGLVAASPNILIVNPEIPATTLAELLEVLKANPGKYTYGSNGAGTSQHLAAELFKAQTGTDILHIPYKGSGSMILDVIAGHIDMSFDNMPTALAQMKAGTVRGLAVTSPNPMPQAPGLPTVAELLPGFTSGSWQGLFAPIGLGDSEAAILEAAMAKVLARPEVQAQLEKLGARAGDVTGADFVAFSQGETERWAKVVADAGIKRK